MIESGLHEFHIIMMNTMKKDLKTLKLSGSRNSLSGIIVRIISLIDPLVMKEHQWGRQRMSLYRALSPCHDEKREHVHVYFTEEMYRKIKLLHADLNFYSIAQLVRWLLELFLAMVERYGNSALEEFEKRFKQWGIEEKGLQQSHRRNLRQLSKIVQHLRGQHRLISIYTIHYSPFWILRL
ncbi:MAG: hypothetical protein JW881_07145 [Spirochaetales bacterium]|nr:hypothetical protein [Spirochaetales bacterium]